MIARARVAAFEILQAVSSERADLPSAIAHTRETLDDDRDRALAAEIATGVLRHRSALDHLIATFAKRHIDRLDPEIVTILRLSGYQLLHLTRVPAAAVVDDADGSCASGRHQCRRVRERRPSSRVPEPQRPAASRRPAQPSDRDAAVDTLSTTLSHPRWLAVREIRPPRIQERRTMDAIQQRTRTTDAARQPVEDHTGRVDHAT
jgi:hypothetical protein